MRKIAIWLLGVAATLQMNAATPTKVRVVATPAGPQIAVDGEIVTPRMYFWWGGDRKGNPAAPTNCTDYAVERMAADAGVRLFEIGMTPAKTRKGLNFGNCDRIMRRAIETCPEGRFVIRINCNAPDWLLEDHPDWRMVYETSKPTEHPQDPYYASPSCEGYREWVTQYIVECGRHYRETFPRNFAGLHVAGQNSGEWFYDRSWWNICGYDRHTLAAWRRHLKAIGAADWETAEVPDGAARRAAGEGRYLLDPVKDARIIEFNRFLQNEMADLVALMVHAIRRGVGPDLLASAFYGYAWELSAFRTSPAASGHYGLTRLLERTAGELDFLCGPVSYTNRGFPNGTATMMAAVETLRRHGVMWFDEDDTRTYLAPKQPLRNVTNSVQSCAIMMRNTAQQAILGVGSWWMDLGAGGWFDDPALWEVQKRLKPIEQALTRRMRPYAPDVAVIIGEDCQLHIACNRIDMTYPLMYLSRDAFNRSGVRYGQYTLEDVVADPPAAKVQFFLNAHRLTAAQRAALDADVVRHPDRVRVWCVAEDSQPIAADPLAIQSRGQGYEVEVRTHKLTKELIRRIAELAGIHLYLREGEATICADAGYVMAYATATGKVTVDAGFSPIYDAFTGKKLSDNSVATFDMTAGQTIMMTAMAVNDEVKQIICWGDSITEGMAMKRDETYPARLQARLGDGFKVVNCGDGGEDVVTIPARQGALSLVTAKPIAFAAGETKVQIGDADDNGIHTVDGRHLKLTAPLGRELPVNPVKIGGRDYKVSFTEFKWNTKDHPISYKFWLERGDASAAMTIPAGTPVTFASTMAASRAYCEIFLMGANGGWNNRVEELIADYRRMINRRGADKPYLVVIPYWKEITAQQMAAFKAAFGEHAVDFRGEAIARGLAFEHLQAQASDKDEIAKGRIPTGLLYKNYPNCHLNREGYDFLAQVIHERGEQLGYWRSRAATPTSRFDWSSWWAKPGYWQRRNEGARRVIAANKSKQFDIVFCGDSNTQNWEGWTDPIDIANLRQGIAEGKITEERAFIAPRQAWLDFQRDYQVLNLGISGDSTHHLLWRLTEGGLLDGYQARFFCVLIGANNCYQKGEAGEPSNIFAGIRNIIAAIRAKHPESKIILCKCTPSHREPTHWVEVRHERVNELIPLLANGKDVILCDFTAKLRNADGTQNKQYYADGLHVNEAGFKIWSDAVRAIVDPIAKPTE